MTSPTPTCPASLGSADGVSAFSSAANKTGVVLFVDERDLGASMRSAVSWDQYHPPVSPLNKDTLSSLIDNPLDPASPVPIRPSLHLRAYRIPSDK